MLPRNVYMSDSMPNRSGSHRGVVARPYVDAGPATSASTVSVGRPDIPSYTLGGGPIQSRTAPRRRGVFTTLGKGFVSTLRGGRGISSTSAPNLGDIWLFGGPAWPDNHAWTQLVASNKRTRSLECTCITAFALLTVDVCFDMKLGRLDMHLQ